MGKKNCSLLEQMAVAIQRVYAFFYVSVPYFQETSCAEDDVAGFMKQKRELVATQTGTLLASEVNRDMEINGMVEEGGEGIGLLGF